MSFNDKCHACSGSGKTTAQGMVLGYGIVGSTCGCCGGTGKYSR